MSNVASTSSSSSSSSTSSSTTLTTTSGGIKRSRPEQDLTSSSSTTTSASTSRSSPFGIGPLNDPKEVERIRERSRRIKAQWNYSQEEEEEEEEEEEQVIVKDFDEPDTERSSSDLELEPPMTSSYKRKGKEGLVMNASRHHRQVNQTVLDLTSEEQSSQIELELEEEQEPEFDVPVRPPSPDDLPSLSTLSCPICFGSPTPIAVTQCGHVFCAPCLHTALTAGPPLTPPPYNPPPPPPQPLPNRNRGGAHQQQQHRAGGGLFGGANNGAYQQAGDLLNWRDDQGVDDDYGYIQNRYQVVDNYFNTVNGGGGGGGGIIRGGGARGRGRGGRGVTNVPARNEMIRMTELDKHCPVCRKPLIGGWGRPLRGVILRMEPKVKS